MIGAHLSRRASPQTVRPVPAPWHLSPKGRKVTRPLPVSRRRRRRLRRTLRGGRSSLDGGQAARRSQPDYRAIRRSMTQGSGIFGRTTRIPAATPDPAGALSLRALGLAPNSARDAPKNYPERQAGIVWPLCSAHRPCACSQLITAIGVPSSLMNWSGPRNVM